MPQLRKVHEDEDDTESNEDDKASFQFFADSAKNVAHRKVQQVEEVHPKTKKEIMLQYAQAASNMTRMLVKMGLMDMHGNLLPNCPENRKE